MTLLLRRSVTAAFCAAVLTGFSAASSLAASPDFYGIKMNSENHARDLSPDELSLFPVRRGFDKNVYAYAHLDVLLDHTRSITFTIFNNTDNDLLVEKSFREFYVVLRNGERYRLNEPGLTWGAVDRVQARGSGNLRADFGDLNVTKEQIEMVVCSFDMGKVKIVLLPIAVDPPPAVSQKEAQRLSGLAPEKDAAAVYAKDQVEPRVRGENEVRRAGSGGSGRFPVMDLPIFSWLKNASAPPATEIKSVSAKKQEAASSQKPAAHTNISTKPAGGSAQKDTTPKPPAPLSSEASKAPAGTAPLAQATAQKPVRRGLFESLFPFLSSDPSRRSQPKAKPAAGPKAASSKAATSPEGEKEYFWKPRDLAPIRSIAEVEADNKKSSTKSLGSDRKPAEPKAASSKKKTSEPQTAKPFYMRRVLPEDTVIPGDEPVSAVSSPNSKSKAPALKPKQKLRAVTPRQSAQVSQVNRQFRFVVVNAGSKDGIKENMVLNIYRHGKVIAKAIVRKATEDSSAALLMKEWSWEDVSVGDPVSLY